MKIVMIGLLALLLLGAGGAGGYFYFQKTAIASLGAVDEHAQAAKEAKALAAQEALDKTAKVRFVELAPMILPIIDEEGVSQVVTLIVSIEVIGDENKDYAKHLAPRLKDAFIQDMYGVLNRKASMDGGMIKVDKLKARLMRASARVLGEGRVNDVLLQVVSQRPI